MTRIHVMSTGELPPDPETFGSLDELREDLKLSADEEYAATVLGKIEAGEKEFIIANGPGDYDHYTVEED